MKMNHPARPVALTAAMLTSLVLLSCGGREIPSPPVPAEEVFPSLPDPERGEVIALLQELRENEQVEPLPAEPAREVPDATLAAALPPETRDASLARWKQLRDEIAAAEARLQELRNEIGIWENLAVKLRGRRKLGPARIEVLALLRNLRTLGERQEAALDALRKTLDRDRESAGLARIAARFTRTDWLVIALYLIFTTILGGILAGRQATIRDFFLGGRKLPWYAVCGSIIATELSAATFLIAPAIVFSKGGDMTYIQLAIGTIIARFIIGYFFVPAFYEREIYSPYDYMGDRLGPRVRNITTLLFMVGAVLAQGARVYIAALALQVITGANIEFSIILIGVVSILWTWMGGIRTVIWTDVIQFLIFFAGAVIAFFFVARAVDGGILAVFSESAVAGKLTFLNLNLNTKEAYTLWCGLFACGFLTLASHGTDQMMAQRVFTCRGPDAARKAVIWSSLSQVVVLVLLGVGAGLFVFYQHNPLSPAEQVVVDAQSMKIFAIFIVDVLPRGVSGLLMAGLFATAISTLDSVLAALSQSTIATVYRPLVKPEGSERHYLAVSRVLVIFWGALMTAFAIFCDVLQRGFDDLIQFALAMAAYTYGALLGTLLLALLPANRDDRGLLWGVPLSMLTVFALSWHTPITQTVVVAACLILVIFAFRELRGEPEKVLLVSFVAGLVVLVSLAVLGRDATGLPRHIDLAWPWHFPIGTGITLGVGYLVGRPRSPRPESPVQDMPESMR